MKHEERTRVGAVVSTGGDPWLQPGSWKADATTKAQRHQAHYRTCGCLGDKAECCDPSCCPGEKRE